MCPLFLFCVICTYIEEEAVGQFCDQPQCVLNKIKWKSKAHASADKSISFVVYRHEQTSECTERRQGDVGPKADSL